MKILVAGINYAPDLIGIAKYTTEMCLYLSQKGHDVRVVTAPPYYPEWQIAKPYSGFTYRTEMLDNVKVVRCPLFVPKTPRAMSRILHHLSFALASGPALIREAIGFRPDIVLSIAPSLLGTPAAIVAGKLTGAGTWLHIQDFEVDAAFDMKFLSGGRLRRAALSFESCLLKAFDKVSAISTKMVEILENKGVSSSRAVEFRNWVDTAATSDVTDDDGAMRDSLLRGEQRTIALYAGNMGAKQGLDILSSAAAMLAAARPDILFVFCGAGAFKARLVELCDGLPNVKFLELQPADKFGQLMRAADIHLLPQCREIQDLVLPSKLGAMLASGQPIVAMAHPATQLASELADVSIVVPPNDIDAVASAVIQLADDPALRQSLGSRGLQLARLRWDRDVVLSRFEKMLCEFNVKRRSRPIVSKIAESSVSIQGIVAREDELHFSKTKQVH